MTSILGYTLRKVATGVATLALVCVLVFVAMQLIPGDYARIMLGPYASDQARALVEARYGLDRPLPLQLLSWLGNVARGDFGVSLTTGTPVGVLLDDWVPVTAELALLSFLFTVVVALPLALVSGVARSRRVRQTARLGGVVAMSTPDFIIGSLLVYLFSRFSLGLPVNGYVPFVTDPGQNLRAMVLPVLCLSIFGLALVVRTGRDAVANVMSSPHVTAARARGDSLSHIVRHHVLRNASIPVLTVLATYIGYSMGGAVIVEQLFTLPGMGKAALIGVQNRDYAVVQGVVVVGAGVFIATSMIADVLYAVIDPRLRKVGG